MRPRLQHFTDSRRQSATRSSRASATGDAVGSTGVARGGRASGLSQEFFAWGQRLLGGKGSHNEADGGIFDPGRYVVTPTSSDDPKAARAEIVKRTLGLLRSVLAIDFKNFNKYSPGQGDFVDQHPAALRSDLQRLAKALIFDASQAEIKALMPVLGMIYQRIAYLDQNSKPPAVAARQCKDLNQRLGFEMPDHPMVFPVGTGS